MQILVNGLIDGFAISLLALAFTLVYVPAKVFHIALAGVYSAAPFVVWTCLEGSLPWYIAFPAGVVAGALLSLACELCNHRWLIRRRASMETHLVSSLGLFVLIEQTVAIIWGNEPKVLRKGLDDVFEIGSVIVTKAQGITAGTAFLVLCPTLLCLWMAPVGLRLRGLAENPVEMQLRGHNVVMLRIVAFSASGILAACASITRAHDLGFSAHGGLNMLLVAVVAVIVGGRHSFVGPVLAGLLLGLARAGTVWFFSARWEAATTFLILAVFLLLRPQGLISRRRRLEASIQ